MPVVRQPEREARSATGPWPWPQASAGAKPAALFSLATGAMSDAVAQDPLHELMAWIGRHEVRSHCDAAVAGEAVGVIPADGSSHIGASPSVPDQAADEGKAAGQVPPAASAKWDLCSRARRFQNRSGLGGEINGISDLTSGLNHTAAVELDPEEQEWNYRQQLTGSVGRLVHYGAEESPTQDIRLRGGCGRRVVVTSVTTGGNAFMTGVKAGDVLVSLNGKKDFKEMSAEALQESLSAPVTLIFMGFCGKLQAEVRLNQKEKEFGLSSSAKVLIDNKKRPVRVVDEVIFQASGTPLLLATMPHKPSSSSSSSARNSRPSLSSTGSAEGSDHEDLGCEREDDDRGVEGTGGTCEETSPRGEGAAGVYELRGPDAKKILSYVLSHPLALPKSEENPSLMKAQPHYPKASIRIPRKSCMDDSGDLLASLGPDAEDDSEISLAI